MRIFYELIHNAIAHPLLALVMPLRFVIWFVELLHDVTGDLMSDGK